MAGGAEDTVLKTLPLQPAGRAGLNRPELRTLLLRYHIPVCRVLELNTSFSGWRAAETVSKPLPLQPAGRVGLNRPELRTLLLRYHIAVCRVLELNRT